MKFRIIHFIFLLVGPISLPGCSSTPVNEELCPNIFIYSPEKVELNETEKRLVCGDPSDESYKVVPLYQAKYMLQGFLQSKGYSHPRFVYDESILNVYTEEKSHLKKIDFKSDNEIETKKLQKKILKRFRNAEITPKLLDQIEALTKSMARNEGYPCVSVTSTAEPTEEKITIVLTHLNKFNFGPLEISPIEGLDIATHQRFTAFNPDEIFNESDLNLTEKRYIRQGIVQGTYFKEKCDLEKNTFALSQDFILGPPRVIRLGVGASTELGPMTRLSWNHQRFGDMASILEARLQASLKNQSLKLSSDQFLWKSAPRRSLNSELSFERNDQENFKETITTLSPMINWTKDTNSRFWFWGLGPTLINSTYKTDALNSNRNFKTAALTGSMQSKTHTYEFYDIHPEEGNFYQLHFDLRHPSLGFTDPLLKLDLNFLQFLWLGSWGKGSGIAGLNISSSTTWVKESVELSDLPPSVKFYGGGSDDIRGFKLNSLPDNSGLGALSKLSLKLELRKTYFFKESLESFTFLDTAFFGDRPWKVESRMWYSPGVGLRWFSPIGLIQSYVARSLTNEATTHFNQDEKFLFFLGLGGVF